LSVTIILDTIFRVLLLIGFVLIVNCLYVSFCYFVSQVWTGFTERWQEILFWIIMIAIFIGSVWLGIVLIF
jgi:hypothetical protein